MKESKSMMKKEVSFMKKKGAPKSMIKHEEAEMEGKKMRKFAAGGRLSYADLQKQKEATRAREAAFRQANSVEARAAAQRAARSASMAPRPATPMGGAAPGVMGAGGTQAMMNKGGSVKKYARGGGIESKGKTRGEIIKMAMGGMSNMGGMGLQKRQFGTGPGMRPMPKHLGKPISRAGGGAIGGASKRADGCATKGKTKGRMV